MSVSPPFAIKLSYQNFIVITHWLSLESKLSCLFMDSLYQSIFSLCIISLVKHENVYNLFVVFDFKNFFNRASLLHSIHFVIFTINNFYKVWQVALLIISL